MASDHNRLLRRTGDVPGSWVYRRLFVERDDVFTDSLLVPSSRRNQVYLRHNFLPGNQQKSMQRQSECTDSLAYPNSSCIRFLRRPNGFRRLQVIGGGSFFFMILIGALLCCVCCCIRAGIVRSRNTRRRDAEGRRQTEALFGSPSSSREANRVQESTNNRTSGTVNMDSVQGSSPPIARATVAGQEFGLNLNDIESIRQFITAESSRVVLEELASALEESRKEYINSHLIKVVVTNDDIARMNEPTQSIEDDAAITLDRSPTKSNEEEKMKEENENEGETSLEAHAVECSEQVQGVANGLAMGAAKPIHPLEGAVDITSGSKTTTYTQSQSPDNHVFSDECCCTICLEDYKMGDVVCRSRNAALDGCTHRFHEHCISGWLMNHDDCPCCRTNFFNVPVHTEAGRGNDPSSEDTKIDDQSHSSNS